VIYVLGWLGIGVTTLVVIFVVSRLPGQPAVDGDAEPVAQSARDLLDPFYTSHGSVVQRILSNLVLPLLALFLVVTAWPYAIWMAISEALDRKQKAAATPFREFAVEPAHLQQRLSIEAIEQREMVSDPMNATPSLPFGHLHNVWRNFVEIQPEGGELWSFSAQWVTEQGVKELRSGYVAVLNGVPGTYLMTRCKPVDDNQAKGYSISP
jgi:hypothetical protein